MPRLSMDMAGHVYSHYDQDNDLKVQDPHAKTKVPCFKTDKTRRTV